MLAFDPARDQEVLSDYLKNFEISFTGIVGERNEIEKLIEKIESYCCLEKSLPDDDAFDVSRSSTVTLINPISRNKAKINAPFQPLNDVTCLFRDIRGLAPLN
jgi:protein SCO1/2